MKMISADEAREFVEGRKHPLRIKKELRKLNRAIKIEAKKGDTSLWYRYDPTSYSRESVEELAKILRETYNYRAEVKKTLCNYYKLTVEW